MSLNSAAKSLVGLFQEFIPGYRQIDGGDLAALVNLNFGTKPGIVALAGGGAAGAPVMAQYFNEVATVANNGDSVLLPPALIGSEVQIINNGANTLAVFAQPAGGNPANGNTADVIIATANAGGAGAASQNQATAKVGTYICYKLGFWKQYLGA